MGKVTQVLCDACERDLTYTGNTVDYQLVLTFAAKAHQSGGGAFTLMHIEPPIDRAYYFCGLGCLDKWREGREDMRLIPRRGFKRFLGDVPFLSLLLSKVCTDDNSSTVRLAWRWEKCPPLRDESGAKG